MAEKIAGWWYTYPSEKYRSLGIIIPNKWKNTKCSKPPSSLASSSRFVHHSGNMLAGSGKWNPLTLENYGSCFCWPRFLKECDEWLSFLWRENWKYERQFRLRTISAMRGSTSHGKKRCFWYSQNTIEKVENLDSLQRIVKTEHGSIIARTCITACHRFQDPQLNGTSMQPMARFSYTHLINDATPPLCLGISCLPSGT